jgi:hypothetical protein
LYIFSIIILIIFGCCWFPFFPVFNWLIEPSAVVTNESANKVQVKNREKQAL